MATAPKDTECDEDQDYDDFNIQSPPPYDVIERVREANRLLEQDETPIEKIKSPKVKFKEQIVEFEVDLSDLSSDDAASTDDWMTPQLKVEEEDKQEDKTLLGSDSDDDTSLMPLEDDVKLGFPHRQQCEDSEAPPPLVQTFDINQSIDDQLDINNSLVILVPRESELPSNSPSEPSDDLGPSITETFAASSPISDDIPDTCDGLSLSTDNFSSKLGPESPLTELDISEEFQLSLDLNKDQVIEETSIKTSIKISLQTFPSISIPCSNNNINNNSTDDESKHAKRKDSLKLQHYRKSLEGPISSEWNQFQTVTDGLTPRDVLPTNSTPEPNSNEPKEASKQERPSSSRGAMALTLSNNCERDRPWTAPNSRREGCGSRWSFAQLPNYNGMRSEYGLSQEQLEERKRLRKKIADERRERIRRKKEEEEERRDQNERVFRAWLARKQSENALENNTSGDDPRLSAKLRKEQAEDSFKQWLQRKKHERKMKHRLNVDRAMHSQQDMQYKPEEAQVAFKQWVKSKRKCGPKKHNKRLLLNNDPATLEKILNNLDPHTQSTFRIYLGVSKIEISHKKKNKLS